MTTYAVNATTGGLSVYDGTQWDAVVGITVHDDSVVILTDSSLFVLSGSDDDGSDIDASVETGALYLGSPEHEKICPRIRIHGKAENGLTATVIEHRNGTETEYSYLVDSFGGTESKSQQVRPGKGIRGETLGFRIENVTGGDLRIDRLSINILFGRLP